MNTYAASIAVLVFSVIVLADAYPRGKSRISRHMYIILFLTLFYFYLRRHSGV